MTCKCVARKVDADEIYELPKISQKLGGRTCYLIIAPLVMAVMSVCGTFLWTYRSSDEPFKVYPNFVTVSVISSVMLFILLLVAPRGSRAIVAKLVLVGGLLGVPLAMAYNSVMSVLCEFLSDAVFIGEKPHVMMALAPSVFYYPQSYVAHIMLIILCAFGEELIKLGLLLLFTRLQAVDDVVKGHNKCISCFLVKPVVTVKHFAFFGAAIGFGFSRCENVIYFASAAINNLPWETQLTQALIRTAGSMHELWTCASAGIIGSLFFSRGSVGFSHLFAALTFSTIMHTIMNVAGLVCAVRLQLTTITIVLAIADWIVTVAVVRYINKRSPDVELVMLSLDKSFRS